MNITWQERLFRRAAEDENGCWVWQGRSLKPSGYAMFYGPSVAGKGRIRHAHVFAYIAAHGQYEDGLEIDHLCNVRACINPAHLEAVTPQENSRRRSARQTLCVHGHERVEDEDGRRYCPVCPHAAKQARQARRKRLAREQVSA